MSDNTALNALLRPLLTYLERSDVLEICINQPNEIWIESYTGWETVESEVFDLNYLQSLSISVASFTKQTLNQTSPILSGTLPNGERIQIVMPPAVIKGQFSITIRKPSTRKITMEDYAKSGMFDDVAHLKTSISQTDTNLLGLHKSGKYIEFLKQSVLERKNILVAGSTGSGKTQLTKALVSLVPEYERTITIEDTAELDIPQKNNVRLLYSKGDQGQAKVTSRDLLESSLRMRPDRIHLQELRDSTAFYYLRSINSGHAGSITTIHADSALLAFEQLSLLVKESDAGRDLSRDEIKSMLVQMIDVIVHVSRVSIEGKLTFRANEVYFDPEAKIKGQKVA